MGTKFIAGNWKLNPAEINQAQELAREIRDRTANCSKVNIAVCPPFISLPAVAELLRESRIAVGGQDLYWEEAGAYTGAISAPMLKSAGCSYVIIGHSERRQYFGETDETVCRKLYAALKGGLKPIVCVGETLQQRKAGQLHDVIRTQVTEALRGMDETSLGDLVVAYEPIWAIGTGVTATPQQAQEMHAYIRSLLNDHFSHALAMTTPLLYGGSVKSDNATELLSQNDIDGALVGGASLKVDTFVPIIESGEELS
ncbi:MAG: triose-phosphate isomerase [bacterium]